MTVEKITENLPRPNDEDWRFTPITRLVAAIKGGEGAVSSQAINIDTAVAAARLPGCDAVVMVDGMVTQPIASMQAMKTLDTAKFSTMLGERDVARRVLRDVTHYARFAFGGGQAAPKALQIIHVSTGKSNYTPSLLVIALADHAAAEIIESYVELNSQPESMAWRNHLTLIDVGKSAHLRHFIDDRGQNRGQTGFGTQTILAQLEEKARMEAVALKLGQGLAKTQKPAGFSRLDLKIKLAGEHADFTLAAAHILAAHHHTLATKIFHDTANTSSRQIIKNIVASCGEAVVQGLIQVAPHAQKTNAHLLSRGMILSPPDHAQAGNILFKPELKIYADDVKCSHGATVGGLDDAALFYLATRGISPDAAQAMLFSAFIEDAFADLAGFSCPNLQQMAQNWAENYLEKILDARGA
ncbi:MAG: SufD family Fe-S cluster assembly protein [Candidatus Symbiobacter sp.]|nr:SufD family Fe-S cluster assembly protein [Candidatus Symbiobacter sp.]